MLGFVPISTLAFSNIVQRSYFGVDDIIVTFSVDAFGITQNYQLDVDDVSVGVDTTEPNLTMTYICNTPVIDVKIKLGDVRFTWDLQEDVAETWIEQSRFPKSDNNYIWTIVEAVFDASQYKEPEATLFVYAEAIQGRPLADVNNTGAVTYLDGVDIGNYIKGAPIDQNKIDYIENYMLPYMAENQDLYKSYYNVSGSRKLETWSSISTQTENWTNVA